MSRATRLTDEQIADALTTLSGWVREGDFLRRDFTFADFDGAMAFLNAAAEVARRLDHHPDWSNVYNRVTVRLQTHDAGGVTNVDVAWAAEVSSLPATGG